MSDYQWKLYLHLRIHMILKAFYCRMEDYILTLLMPWKKNSFYCSLSAILMFADSISRIMIRLLFSTALECVAFFCTEVQKLLSIFLNCGLSNFALQLSEKWMCGRALLDNWLSRYLPVATAVGLYGFVFIWMKEKRTIEVIIFSLFWVGLVFLNSPIFQHYSLEYQMTFAT